MRSHASARYAGHGNSNAPERIATGALGGYMEPDDDLLSREIQPTIIGAEAFHGPVRDGKAWDHLAMVVRQRGVTAGGATGGGGAGRRNWGEAKRWGVRARGPGCAVRSRRHGYRIKPYGQLVLVSLTPYSASTPSLSTSWS